MTSERQDSVFGSPENLARAIVPEVETTILNLVVEGFQRWQAEGFRRFGDNEDDYTVRLVACMKKIQRERNLAFLPRYQDVVPSNDMFQGLEDSRRAPRIDITVAWDSQTDDSYLSIECKRLALGNLARQYVSEGMKRFVRGFYGPNAKIGGMVGYIVRGTLDSVVRRVNALVERDSTLGSSHTLMSANAVGSLDDVFTSSHVRRSPLQPIRLTHLFFDLNNLPPK